MPFSFYANQIEGQKVSQGVVCFSKIAQEENQVYLQEKSTVDKCKVVASSVIGIDYNDNQVKLQGTYTTTSGHSTGVFCV